VNVGRGRPPFPLIQSVALWILNPAIPIELLELLFLLEKIGLVSAGGLFRCPSFRLLVEMCAFPAQLV
jgi:hypothetical protein